MFNKFLALCRLAAAKGFLFLVLKKRYVKNINFYLINEPNFKYVRLFLFLKNKLFILNIANIRNTIYNVDVKDYIFRKFERK